MGRRRRSRELALQYLYQWDFHGREKEAAELFWESRRESDEVRGFAREICDGVRQKMEDIDPLIESHSQHWKLYRMSRVDRNILRIAVFELTCLADIPAKVSIDEAIEIGKKFGTSESASFINGILDKICRQLGIISSSADNRDHDHIGDRNSG
jgi:N utilization substance protein B